MISYSIRLGGECSSIMVPHFIRVLAQGRWICVVCSGWKNKIMEVIEGTINRRAGNTLLVVDNAQQHNENMVIC